MARAEELAEYGIPPCAGDAEIDGGRRNLIMAGAAAVAGLSLAGPALAGTGNESGDRAVTSSSGNSASRVGTIKEPNYYDRIDYRLDDVAYKQKNYSYMGPEGAVVGLVSSLVCTIDRPASEVWPYLKDFNSFEGPFGIRYVGPDDELAVWGDLYSREDHGLGEEILHYAGEKGTWKSAASRVIRVIPEHLLVIWETIPSDGSSNGISPGYHTISLNEHVGKSHISMILEHAERLKVKTEAEALEQSMWGPKKYSYEGSLARWKDDFVPKLKQLVHTATKKPE